MLINADGHVKLTDFGLSRIGFIDDKSNIAIFVFSAKCLKTGNAEVDNEDEDLLMAYYNNRRSIRLSAEDVNSANASAAASTVNSTSTTPISNTPPHSDPPAHPALVRTTSAGSRTSPLRTSSNNPLRTSSPIPQSDTNSNDDTNDSSSSSRTTTPTPMTNDASGPDILRVSNSNLNSRKSPVPARSRRNTMKKVVGTPDYLSPEILLGTGHGKY